MKKPWSSNFLPEENIHESSAIINQAPITPKDTSSSAETWIPRQEATNLSFPQAADNYCPNNCELQSNNYNYYSEGNDTNATTQQYYPELFDETSAPFLHENESAGGWNSLQTIPSHLSNEQTLVPNVNTSTSNAELLQNSTIQNNIVPTSQALLNSYRINHLPISQRQKLLNVHPPDQTLVPNINISSSNAELHFAPQNNSIQSDTISASESLLYWSYPTNHQSVNQRQNAKPLLTEAEKLLRKKESNRKSQASLRSINKKMKDHFENNDKLINNMKDDFINGKDPKEILRQIFRKYKNIPKKEEEKGNICNNERHEKICELKNRVEKSEDYSGWENEEKSKPPAEDTERNAADEDFKFPKNPIPCSPVLFETNDKLIDEMKIDDIDGKDPRQILDQFFEKFNFLPTNTYQRETILLNQYDIHRFAFQTAFHSRLMLILPLIFWIFITFLGIGLIILLLFLFLFSDLI